MIAAIRIRGIIGIEASVEKTMRSMRLYKRNYCAVLKDTAETKGMLAKAKDFITWGEIDEETTKLLQKKSNKTFYRLNSPRKGFGRKGVKRPFALGGALGPRKEKINDLIQRML